MAILQSSLYAVAIGLCIFSAVLIRQAESKVPNRFFMAFLIIQALGFVFEWLMIHPTVPLSMLWLFGVMVLSLFVSPCAWAFAQDLTSSEFNPSLKGFAPHFAVIGVGVLLLIPLFSTLFPEGPFVSMTMPGAAQYSVIHTTMLLTAAVFVLQSAYYIRLCLYFLAERAEQNKDLFTQVSDVGTNTLRILVLAVSANCLVSILRVLYCWALDDGPLLNVFFAVLQVAVLGYVANAVLQQALSPNAGLDKEREALFNATVRRAKYQNSGLVDERRLQVLTEVDRLLTVEKVHHDNRLNLSVLCERLNESPQVVSQVINESDYQNFYQMVNQHRVTDAKALLETRDDLSILDVAYAVGYNSKSTFNTAFKKFAGCNPSEYRNRGTVKAEAQSLPI